jgi:hypothetical protein
MNGHGEEKFGEIRPGDGPKRDEWGNDYREFALMPMKVEKACDPTHCRDHVTVVYSVEQEMPAVSSPLELFALMQKGEPIPTAKQWVPCIRVLNSYN